MSLSTLQRKPKLLIVDDSPRLLILFNQMFKGDYEVYTATSGEQALALCLEQTPNLILLDLMMPDMDGYEVCRRLKSSITTRDIPVIFVTASQSHGDETRALDAGAVDFITKPLNPDVVRARVRTHLRLQQANERLENLLTTQRSIFQAAPYAIFLVNTAGSIVMANALAAEVFGYAEHDLLGLPIEQLVPASGQNTESKKPLLGQRLNGSTFPVEIRQSEVNTLTDAQTLIAVIDITERIQAAELLAAQHAELKRSNEDLSMFAYVASHDLKSPLRGIMQLAAWIEEDIAESNPLEVAKHMTLLRGRIRRMENLLDDLLAYSRAGKVEGSIRQIDINELAHVLFELQSPKPGMKLEIPEALPCISSLNAPFEQVLRNLFSNALKHHDKDTGCIRLTAHPGENHYIHFCVHDDGPGIPPQYHERVFGMFQTLRPRDEVEGSGMGLSLVKKLVETYGGSVHIESDGQRGCTICFSWPLSMERRLK